MFAFLVYYGINVRNEIRAENINHLSSPLPSLPVLISTFFFFFLVLCVQFTMADITVRYSARSSLLYCLTVCFRIFDIVLISYHFCCLLILLYNILCGVRVRAFVYSWIQFHFPEYNFSIVLFNGTWLMTEQLILS